LKIVCPEGNAYRMGWIDPARVELPCVKLARTDYGGYLMRMLNEPKLQNRWRDPS
jgi:hypothetical protein